MVNEYADNGPDLKFSYDGSEIPLHYFEKTLLVYSDGLTSVAKTVKKETGLYEVKNLQFSESGKPIYMKSEKPNSEMFNEEKTYKYDRKERLVMQIRTGYNTMEYEGGNKDIITDTTLIINYGDNNLIESAQFSLDVGMAMKIETEKVEDTLRYQGEMKMTGLMAKSMPGKKKMKKNIMDVIFNKETKTYEAFEKRRGGVIIKQVIDKTGNTVEKVVSVGDNIRSHEKYGYKDRVLNSIEVVKGDDEPEVVYNASGQKVSEQTRRGMVKYEYDDKGNLVQEISINPYSLGLEELTVHKIYYRK
jgi:YD repeat-containing protein